MFPKKPNLLKCSKSLWIFVKMNTANSAAYVSHSLKRCCCFRFRRKLTDRRYFRWSRMNTAAWTPMSLIWRAACFKILTICRNSICHHGHRPWPSLTYTESEKQSSMNGFLVSGRLASRRLSRLADTHRLCCR